MDLFWQRNSPYVLHTERSKKPKPIAETKQQFKTT